MQVACQNSRAYLNGFGGNGAAVIAGLVGGGVAGFLGALNGLDTMRQALITYINSNNYPAGAGPAKQAQIDHRRGQNFYQVRINNLTALILAFQAMAAAMYPGLGAPWF